ncbi:MAG: UDP-N-acetylmuramate dehydrogenase, partial [Lysobacterales bacterium]
VEVGAGENWHDLVTWSVETGLSGLENLALIPGLTGAAPIQNIGAYGVELSSVLHAVTAWDMHQGKWAVLSAEECAFSYRDSMFKSALPGSYFITSVSLRLRKHFEPQLGYAGLAESLDAAGIMQPGPRDIFGAVIGLRQRKLPNPALQGNAGSFFKNPVVSLKQLEDLLHRFNDVPHWPLSQNAAKIAAGWMVDQCQLKGFRLEGAEVSRLHALVLVNTGQASGAAVWKLAQHVQNVVYERFGILLEPEPVIYRRPTA